MKGNGDFSIGSAVWPGTSKLLEEMGELTQVLGKLMGSHGQPNHWDGSDLEVRLTEEIGDLLAALKFFQKHNVTIGGNLAIKRRMKKKLELFEKWHRGEDQELVRTPSAYDMIPVIVEDVEPPHTHPKTHKHAQTGQEHEYNQCWTPYGYCCSCELTDDTAGCTT